MLPYGGLFAVALLVGLVWLVLQYRAERQRASTFDSRDAPQFDDWYEQYYAKQPKPPDKAFVKKALEAFSEAFGVALTRFRPSDRIDAELQLTGKLSLVDAWETVDALLAGIYGMTFQWSREWRTLDDVIRGLAAQCPAKV